MKDGTTIGERVLSIFRKMKNWDITGDYSPRSSGVFGFGIKIARAHQHVGNRNDTPSTHRLGLETPTVAASAVH